jgi:hypothetical protein
VVISEETKGKQNWRGLELSYKEKEDVYIHSYNIKNNAKTKRNNNKTNKHKNI